MHSLLNIVIHKVFYSRLISSETSSIIELLLFQSVYQYRSETNRFEFHNWQKYS